MFIETEARSAIPLTVDTVGENSPNLCSVQINIFTMTLVQQIDNCQQRTDTTESPIHEKTLTNEARIKQLGGALAKWSPIERTRCIKGVFSVVENGSGIVPDRF